MLGSFHEIKSEIWGGFLFFHLTVKNGNETIFEAKQNLNKSFLGQHWSIMLYGLCPYLEIVPVLDYGVQREK